MNPPVDWQSPYSHKTPEVLTQRDLDLEVAQSPAAPHVGLRKRLVDLLSSGVIVDRVCADTAAMPKEQDLLFRWCACNPPCDSYFHSYAPYYPKAAGGWVKMLLYRVALG